MPIRSIGLRVEALSNEAPLALDPDPRRSVTQPAVAAVRKRDGSNACSSPSPKEAESTSSFSQTLIARAFRKSRLATAGDPRVLGSSVDRVNRSGMRKASLLDSSSRSSTGLRVEWIRPILPILIISTHILHLQARFRQCLGRAVSESLSAQPDLTAAFVDGLIFVLSPRRCRRQRTPLRREALQRIEIRHARRWFGG